MSYRSAPTYANGLAIPPRKRGCIGETCPVAAKKGSCFTDTHHMYFARDAYLTKAGVYSRLFNDTHSQVSMARCRHNSGYKNSWHNLYDGVPFPQEDVAARFLEESALLTSLSVKVRDMAYLIVTLTTDDPRRMLTPLSDPRKYTDRLQMVNEQFVDTLPIVSTFEVLPATISGRALERIAYLRQQLPIEEMILAA